LKHLYCKIPGYFGIINSRLSLLFFASGDDFLAPSECNASYSVSCGGYCCQYCCLNPTQVQCGTKEQCGIEEEGLTTVGYILIGIICVVFAGIFIAVFYECYKTRLQVT
jgi:hypothetical protein